LYSTLDIIDVRANAYNAFEARVDAHWKHIFCLNLRGTGNI
jgi:hypothetical protein